MSKFDDIEIPKNIKLETKKTIQKGNRLKNKYKYKYLKIASIFILSLGICIGTLNSSLAENIPFLNTLFEDLSAIKGTPQDYTQYAKSVNLSKSINGISFTIDKVVYDGHKLNFTYTIKSKNKLPRQKDGFYKDTLLLDEMLTVKNGTVTKSTTYGDKYIDDYTYTFMQSYNVNFKGKKPPKVIKLDFMLNKIFTCSTSGKVTESINETFHFKFKVDSNTSVKVIDVNETKNGFTVKSLEISPYSITVNVSFPKSFISNSKENPSSISISTINSLDFPNKDYDKNLDYNTLQVKGNLVFDSIINENVYNIGYSDFDTYVIVKFLDVNNKSINSVTEFKVDIKK